MDSIDWRVLGELQENARLSWSELGRRVGLSAPAVAERVRRLEDAGVITGYRAVVNHEAVGRPLTAFVRARAAGEGFGRLHEVATTRAEVVECHRITGDDCYLMKVTVSSVKELEQLLEELVQCGPTTTSIVLSAVVSHRALGPPAAAPAPDEEFASRAG